MTRTKVQQGLVLKYSIVHSIILAYDLSKLLYAFKPFHSLVQLSKSLVKTRRSILGSD